MATGEPSGDIYDDTLAVFSEPERRFEPLTTTDVAEALGCERRTVYKRLQTLVDRGKLETKKVGSSGRVWWRPPAGPAAVRTADFAGKSVDLDDHGIPADEAFDQTYQFIGFVEPDGTLVEVNRTALSFGGIDRADVVGEPFPAAYWWRISEETQDRLRDAIDRAAGGEFVRYEADVQGEDRVATIDFSLKPVTDEQGEVEMLIAEGRDITARKERERQLERYENIIDAVGDPVYALDTEGRFTFVNQAAVETMGWDADELLGRSVSIVMDDEDVTRTTSIIAELLAAETPDSATHEFEITTKAGDRIPVENHLSVLRDEHGAFEGTAGVLRDITERKERERKLARQRAHLAALDNINGVVREITDAVIEHSTRDAIERATCEQLAVSDSYTFAWIAEVDQRTGEIRPRVERGVDGYFDAIELSADPTEPFGQGPEGRAVRRTEVQVSRDVFADPSFEPWRDAAAEYGFQSGAAIPIVHEDTLYGLIGIYSERAGAFADEEREVVGQLGEIVGHAIAAVERKRALMSDELIEIAFRIREIPGMLDLDGSADGTITCDRTVPVGDGSFLVYCTVTGDALTVMAELADDETFPTWESLQILGTDGESSRCEIRVTDPPVLSTVAAHDGYIHEATIEGGDLRMTIHVPPESDVQDTISEITDTTPAEMVMRHQIIRSDQPPQQLNIVFSERLTDRQQAALEAGYFAGFFDWPRDSSGEDVAASLGIGASTFHQHIRTAQKKLLDAIFDDGVEPQILGG